MVNLAINLHSVQGGVAILLGMLHAKETGISSGTSCLPLPFSILRIEIKLEITS